MSKGQKASWLFHILVDSLQFSGEYLAERKEVLLDAIEWYRRTQIEGEKWTQQYIDDSRLSLLPNLKKQVESNEGVSGATGDLLAEIVKKYLEHLPKLEQKVWIDKETLERQRDQLSEIVADSLSRKDFLASIRRR